MKICGILFTISVMPSFVTTVETGWSRPLMLRMSDVHQGYYLVPFIMDEDLYSDTSNLVCNETLVMHLPIHMAEVKLLNTFQNGTTIGNLGGPKGKWPRPVFETTETEIKIWQNNISSSATYKYVITYNNGLFMVIDWNISFSGKGSFNKSYEITLRSKLKSGVIQESAGQTFICRRTQVDCLVLGELLKCFQTPKHDSDEGNNNQQTHAVYGGVVTIIIAAVAVCGTIYCCLRRKRRRKRRERDNREKLDHENEQYYTHLNRNGSMCLIENPRCLSPIKIAETLNDGSGCSSMNERP